MSAGGAPAAVDAPALLGSGLPVSAPVATAARASFGGVAGLVLVAVAIGLGYAVVALEDFFDRERTSRAAEQTMARVRLEALSARVAELAEVVALGRGLPAAGEPQPPTAPEAPPGPTTVPPPPTAEVTALRADVAMALAAREAAAAELAQATGKLAFLERQLASLASARAEAERDRDELARQLALRITAEAPARGSSAPGTPPPSGNLDGAPLLALVARIDEHLSHDSRLPRLRFVSARALSGEAFLDVVLEERAANGAVTRRTRAGKATFELYQALRLVRVRLAACHLTEDPDAGGRELRLPELAVERYDVDIKSWRELARETEAVWLALR